MTPMPKKPSKKVRSDRALQRKTINSSLDRAKTKPTNSTSRKGGAVEKEGS